MKYHISELNTLQDYKTKGREIKETYCVTEDNFPVMLPPAPKQKYIDVYMNEEDSSTKKVRDAERRLQADYEVKIYRSLERLEENILVLHGLEYTHHQYRLCDISHDRNECTKTTQKCKDKNLSKREAECDFVVIGGNYFVILEVKNIQQEGDSVTEDKERELAGALEKSGEQQEKVKVLIGGLLKQVLEVDGEEKCPILNFSVFPNTDRRMLLLGREEKQILCKDDLVDFKSWWQKNVTNQVTSADVLETSPAKLNEVKEILLAIWCTDKNQCDALKCSLGRSIVEINEALKRGKITYLSKKRLENPNVMNVAHEKVKNVCYIDADSNHTVNIFKDILSVDNLTSEQNYAFGRNENMLIINGPAGSGKTVILLAKMIQFIKSDEQNRAALIIFKGAPDKNSTKRYRDILQEAGISNIAVIQDYSDDDSDTILQCRKIIESTSGEKNNKVVIVEVPNRFFEVATKIRDLLNLIAGLTRLHVFIDDYQILHGQYELKLPELLEIFRKRDSGNNSIWITCDLTQRSEVVVSDVIEVNPAIIREVPSVNIVTLSLNLRNTCDISGILYTIREQIVHHTDITGTADVDMVLPVLKPGHYIHGPKTIIHVINNTIEKSWFNLMDENSLLNGILNTELDKLLGACGSSRFDIGIVCNRYDFNTIVKKSIEGRISDNNIELCNALSCYSAEYPAVIVLHDAYSPVDIAPLYLMISRARAYCSVILFTSVSHHISSLLEAKPLNDLLNELRDCATIIRHD